MDKTLDLDELERVASDVRDDLAMMAVSCSVDMELWDRFSNGVLTLIAAARPAVVSDEAIILQAHDAIEAAREAMRGAVEPDDRALYEKVNSALYAIRGRPALALLPGGVPDGWQPIATAPRDGTWFVALQDGLTYPCDWREVEDDEGPTQSGWWDFFNQSFESPTHWAPVAMLSASPKGSSQSQPCADGALPVLTETPHSAGKPDPNPEWEAKADAEHAAIREEVGECDPLVTLTMLKTWKAHAEPADQDGRITFSRAMLDSAEDALEVALKLSSGGFVRGAQEAREMLARFVEQGGDAVIANSIRLNWNPSWGDDPGPPDRPDADTTERQPSPRDEQNPSASPKEVK